MIVNYMRRNAIGKENQISRYIHRDVWVGRRESNSEKKGDTKCAQICTYSYVCVCLHSHLFLSTYVTDSRARGGAGGGTYHRDDAFG